MGFAENGAAVPKDTVESLESGREMKGWVSFQAILCIMVVMCCRKQGRRGGN